MSRTEKDIEAQIGKKPLGPTRSLGTLPPRSELNAWMRRSLGAKIPEDSAPIASTKADPSASARPDSGGDKPAIGAYNTIKAELDTALVPFGFKLNPSFGVFDQVIKLQAELGPINNDYLAKADTAPESELDPLVKTIAEKLPALTDLKQKALRKKAVMDEFQRISLDVQNAKSKLTATLAPIKQDLGVATAETELQAAFQGYITGAMKATAEEQQKLLDAIKAKLPAAADAVDKVDAFLLHKPAIDQARIAVTTLADAPDTAKKAVGELDKALKAYDANLKAADAKTTGTLAKTVADKLGPAQKAVVDGIKTSVAGGTKKKDVRKQVLALLKNDKDVLNSLTDDAAGRKCLDELVADIGDKAEGEDNEFMQAAIKARFGLAELKGNLSRKALPKLYEAMKMVPPSHTRDNDKLKELKRNKNWRPDSWYSTGTDTDEGVGEHHVVLNGVRSGGFLGRVQDVMLETGVWKASEQKARHAEGKEKMRNAFTAVTLHEIGHAVDEKQGIMAAALKTQKPALGGWKEETPASIAQVAVTAFEVDKEFTGKAYPRAFLEKYFAQVLQGQEAAAEGAADVQPDVFLNDAAVVQADTDHSDPGFKNKTEKDKKKLVEAAMKMTKLKDKRKGVVESVVKDIILENEAKANAVKNVLAQFSTLEQNQDAPDWKKLAKHKAAQWCRDIRMGGGESGVWSKGSSGAEKLSPDGNRVYHEAYKGEWYSYDLQARGKILTNYQFRAPGEWYAEAYAFFFQGMLPTNHPIYADLKKDQDAAANA